MRPFDYKLSEILNEMASLVGWEPTEEQEYEILYNGKPIDANTQSATSPLEAIKMLSRDTDNVKIAADDLGITPEELLADLTARVRKSVDDSRGFNIKDIKSINSKETLASIQTWLNANPTPYKWHIKFGSHYVVEPTPGVITFVKTGNIGMDTLTPHMIMHTAGHVMCGNNNMMNRDLDRLNANLTHNLIDYISAKMNDVAGASSPRGVLIALCKLLHMKAATYTITGGPRSFPSIEEAIIEMAGVYAKNGRITIRPNKYCDFAISTSDLDDIKRTLEGNFATMLNNMVGRVVYDD